MARWTIDWTIGLGTLDELVDKIQSVSNASGLRKMNALTVEVSAFFGAIDIGNINVTSTPNDLSDSVYAFVYEAIEDAGWNPNEIKYSMKYTYGESQGEEVEPEVDIPEPLVLAEPEPELEEIDEDEEEEEVFIIARDSRGRFLPGQDFPRDERGRFVSAGKPKPKPEKKQDPEIAAGIRDSRGRFVKGQSPPRGADGRFLKRGEK